MDLSAIYAKDLIELISVRENTETSSCKPINPTIVKYMQKKLTEIGYKSLPCTDKETGLVEAELFYDKDFTLMFQGHLDTVPIGPDWTFSQGETIEGVLYGRGTNDNKGPIGALLAALEETTHRPAICLTHDEETKFCGIYAAIDEIHKNQFPVKAILNIEPSNYDVIIARKGYAHGKITVFGKAVHSCAPELGKNAIYEACNIVDTIKCVANEDVPEDCLLGKRTISVGKIYTPQGSRSNVVPDRCYIEFDARTIPQEEDSQLINKITKKLDCSDIKLGVDYQIETTSSDLPYILDCNIPWIVNVLSSTKKIWPESKFTGESTFAESAPLISAGMPSISLGPPKTNIHSANEFIKLKDLVKLKDIYKTIINDFYNSPRV